MPRKPTAPPKPARTLALDITAATGKRHVAYLRRHLRAAHRMLRPLLTELSVALVGDARMAALHARFRGIAGPTDVLTFPLDVDRLGRAASGEVVVCVPEAVRRAKGTNGAVERELLLYALHGLLHLCGYDDRTGSGYRRMHRREDMILIQLGVGPVFQPDTPAPPVTARRVSPPPLIQARRGRGSGSTRR